jgi:hypothetical protein
LENIDEMDKFTDTYDLPELKHEDMKNLNRTITSEIESIVFEILSKRKNPGPDGFLI